MKIYHYSSTTFEYIGDSEAAPSPLAPGEYLMPPNTTTVSPPTLVANQAAVWDGSSWRIVPDFRSLPACCIDSNGFFLTSYTMCLGDTFTSTIIQASPPLSGIKKPQWVNGAWVSGQTLDEVKADKLAALASYRFDVETAGISVGGVNIKTDRESQAMLTGAYTLMTMDPSRQINWKGGNKWSHTDNVTLAAVALAVGNHVQSCFDKEEAHYNAIVVLTSIEEVKNYDFSTGW